MYLLYIYYTYMLYMHIYVCIYIVVSPELDLFIVTGLCNLLAFDYSSMFTVEKGLFFHIL